MPQVKYHWLSINTVMLKYYHFIVLASFATGIFANTVINCLVAPNCTAVRCASPNCTEGQRPVVHPCSCCQTCEDIVEDCGCSSDACFTVKCGVRGECPKGQQEAMGGYCNCCRVCKASCVVLCPLIKCASGYRSVKHGCCNACVKIAGSCDKCTCLRNVANNVTSVQEARVCDYNQYCIEGKCVSYL
ncbi:unnamed protein product [Brassicogethes aeneus]|uniref:Uncharacterized protein n=1 Tax=Brassicogethes aeneus TaxID=1431903 RepID=A0A9P0B816_BRAAE|nr:unnamed protein product [Brassicogethes aeneus]